MQEIINNPNVRIAGYVLIGFLALNLVLIVVNIITKGPGVFGAHAKARDYFGKIALEMKLVEWLNANTTAKLTVLALVSIITLGGIVALFDLIFFKIRDLLLV